MIICLDVRFRTLSGTATVINNLLPALIKANRKYEFLILKYKNQNIHGIDGLKKIYAPDGNPIFELCWVQLLLPGILNKLGCKLYVSFKQPVGPFFSKILKIFYVHNIFGKFKGNEYPVRWTAHIYWYILGKLNILNSDRLIAVSEFIKEYLIEGMGYPADKIDVAPNGVDLGFRKLSQREIDENRKRLNFPENYILSCGNIVPVKNHETAVRILKVVLDKFPNMKLIIAGGTTFTHFNKVKSLVHNLGLEENVIFTGFLPRSKLVTLYSSARAFLFTSLTESSAISSMEAMACSLPIIASNRGAIPETCGDAGIYIDDPKDYNAFAEAICRLLLNKEMQQDLAEKALSRAKNLSWQKAAIKSLQAFAKALKTD